MAQDPADLSGVWQMDASRSESAHQATPIGPVTMIIQQQAGQLSVETRKSSAKKAEVSTETLTYKLDGSETSTVDKAGVQIKAKARWDGPRLVTETARNLQGSTVTTLCIFSVDPSGKELTVAKSLTVQHGYQFEGAANTGKATDVFIRSKRVVRQ
jgi:hypothetical protein